MAATLGGSSISGTWSGGTGFSNTTNPLAVYTPSAADIAAGDVTLTWTPNIAGPTACPLAADQVDLTINPLPIAPTPVSNNGPVCAGNALTLSSATVANVTYAWSGPNAFVSSAEDATVNLSATTLMSGTYYITITDAFGCASLLDSTIVTVNATPVALLPGNNGPVCSGSSLNLTSNTIAGTYSWTGPNGFTSSLEDPNVSATATMAMAGTYSVTISSGTCTSPIATTVVNVNASPVIDITSISLVDASCGNSDGSITGIVTTGTAVLSYVWNGGAPNTVTSDLVSSIPVGSYTLIVTDGNTCTATAGSFSIANVGAPAAPTASVTVQPTCAAPTGTIVITAPMGATIEYSNGGAYQAGTTFSGLTPGSYIITSKDIGSGCISTATNLTVNAVPTVAAPTASVTVQPTCTTPTGTIVVTAPTGASIQYSSGGAYQVGTTFSGLTPGAYSITEQDMTTSCISSPTALTVDPVPTIATPTASVTVQPTCTIPSGTIVVTAPTGASIQYSSGGAYQAGTTFQT
jgi:hypothetical protein